jgi:hypothetical protein
MAFGASRSPLRTRLNLTAQELPPRDARAGRRYSLTLYPITLPGDGIGYSPNRYCTWQEPQAFGIISCHVVAPGTPNAAA